MIKSLKFWKGVSSKKKKKNPGFPERKNTRNLHYNFKNNMWLGLDKKKLINRKSH